VLKWSIARPPARDHHKRTGHQAHAAKTPAPFALSAALPRSRGAPVDPHGAQLDAQIPGNRGLWLKVKCLNREEFVVIGWTDPEGSRPWLGALLLGYYDPTVGWSMPGASEPESAMRSLNVCGAASNR